MASSIRPTSPIKPLALTHERRRQSIANMEAQQQDPLLVSLRKSSIVPIPLGHAPTSPGLSASLSSSPSDTISSSPPPASLDELSRMSSMSSTAAPADQLFDASLISPDLAKSFPHGYTVRPLTKGDYKKGFLDVLRVLTTVGEISEQRWLERFDYMKRREGDYYLIVVEDGSGKIVGTGAVIVERKFIHDLGLVGHIEDISVAKDQQGKKLGLRIIETLDSIAKRVGCYKSILDCSEANEGFYVKCGYKRAGLEMSHYY